MTSDETPQPEPTEEPDRGERPDQIGPRGNQDVEADEVRRGQEKIDRIAGN